jgi:hypothetical protein
MGEISLTTDIWSDQNRKSYLAITAHWIAKLEGTTSLQLKASLIAFHRLHGGHDGEALAETVYSFLIGLGSLLRYRPRLLSYNCC